MTSRGEHIRLEKGSIVKHHYEVVSSVGSGNFSKVYRVIDLQLPTKEQKRKPLAMKVIKKEYSSDAKYEKQMLIALHKNDKNHTARVSKMYECFVFQECPVFIMPIHGPSIRSRRLGINRGVVTREKLLEFAYDVLETMDFVHFQCHMVHTDLKPENILIADSNVAENSIGDEWVVCDFGSASLWRMDKLDSDLISTRPYRAPEVVLGNKWHYAADMWSMGCILYEVAVGHRLFEIRDDLTHLHMMDRRIGKLPEAFTKGSKYSSKFFNSRGEFLSTPDVIRFGKCRLSPLKDVFRDDREFLHLLEGLLIYDPSRRMTATEALTMPLFDEVRQARARRLGRESEESEACRQRRAATVAAAGSIPVASTTNTGSGSFTSTINGVAGTLKPRLTDRTDNNVGEGKKTPQSAFTSMDDLTAVATKVSASSASQRSAEEVGAADEGKEAQTPLTGRSATETTTSHISLHVSTGKEVDKSRSSRSNTGSVSRHSTTACVAVGAAAQPKSGKTRARAVSTPAGLARGSNNESNGVGAELNSSTVLSSAPATGKDSAVVKEIPNHRAVVDNHRAFTGSLATSQSTTLVPNLALYRMTGNDNTTSAITTATATVGTVKATRTTGSSSSSSSASKHASWQSGNKSAQRTVSPGTERKNSSSNAAAPSTSASKSKSLSSCHTPRKAGRTLRRGSGFSADEVVAATSKERTPPPQRTAAGTSPYVGGSIAANVAEAKHTIPVTLQPSSCVNTNPASAILATTASNKASVTLVRAPSATLPGYQSPLERGVTAVGMTNRSEPPVSIESPGHGHEDEDKVPGEGEEGKQVERGGRDAADICEKDKGDEHEGKDDGHGAAFSSSDGEDEGDGTDTSNLPTPGATNADGSPRATDYRSPVRRRSPVVTSTDDTPAQTSPRATRRFTMYASTSSGEWTNMEAVAAAAAAAAAAASAAMPTTACVPVRTVERAHAHPFPQTQPAPKLALNSPRSEGHRTPREVSPVSITGHANSPITTARWSPQQQAMGSAADASATATSSTILGKGSNVHELASAAPIVRASLSRGNSRSGSLVTTAISSPNPDALARTIGTNSSTAPAIVSALPAHEGTSGQLTAAVTAANGGSTYPAMLRSPHGSSNLTPRAVTAGARQSIHGANAALASAGSTDTLAASPSAASDPTTPGPVRTDASPSMKPDVNVSASIDRLKSVPPSNIADVRGPSAIPVSAFRHTVVKTGPSSINNSTTNNNSNSSSGIPEHPTAQHILTPLPSAPQGAAGVPHLPEAVTRSRERSLVDNTATTAATVVAKEKKSASRRGSSNSLNLAVSATAEATVPKTPLPSASFAHDNNTNNTNSGATGTISLASPLALPSAASHPTSGVVRQRSDSMHLTPVHPTCAGGLESNTSLTASQLGLHTPRGSHVLQEHQAGVSGRRSATLPAMLPGSSNSNSNNNNNHPTTPKANHHSSGAGALTSSPSPSHGNRTSFSIAAPGVMVESDLTSSRHHEHGYAVVTVESRPATPRGSGRLSVKSLDLQKLHPIAATTTCATSSGRTRPPRSSISGSSNAGPSPVSPTAGSGGKSPRCRSKLGNVSSSHGSGQAALNPSTGNLHLGVTRSPRKPVAPGASNNNNNNNGSSSLLVTTDMVSAVSLRSPRSSSRVTTSPRGSGSRKDLSKTVSPRRAPLSPRAKAANGSLSCTIDTEPTVATTGVKTTGSDVSDTSGVSLGVPMQPIPQQPGSMQPVVAGGARLSQPRRTITVISSKRTSSAQLSRYSNVTAVAPTRTTALRPPPTNDLMAPTGKSSTSSGLNSSYKQSGTPLSDSTSVSASAAPLSGQNSQLGSTLESNNVGSAETGLVYGSTGPKYRRDARTLKRIIVQRPSPLSSGASMVSPQELGDDISTSPPTSTN